MKSCRVTTPCATPATATLPPVRKSRQALGLLGIVLLSLPLFSQAGDPCGAVMCLSENKSAPQKCKGHVDDYFNIRVYHARHRYDPGATSVKRYNEVLSHCSEARQEDKDYVQATYGTLEYYPYSFSGSDE